MRLYHANASGCLQDPPATEDSSTAAEPPASAPGVSLQSTEQSLVTTVDDGTKTTADTAAAAGFPISAGGTAPDSNQHAADGGGQAEATGVLTAADKSAADASPDGSTQALLPDKTKASKDDSTGECLLHNDTYTAPCVPRMAQACCVTRCTLHHASHDHRCTLTSIVFCAGAAAVLSLLSALATGLEPDDDAELPHDDSMVPQQTAAAVDGKPVSGGSTGEPSAEPTAGSEVAAAGGAQQEASIAALADTTARHAALDSAMAALTAMVAQPVVSSSAAGADSKGSAADSQAAGPEGAVLAAERAAAGASQALEQAGAAAGAAADAELAGALSAVMHPEDGSGAAEQAAAELAEPQQPVYAVHDSGLTLPTSAGSEV